jgi:hypothetical protein
MSSQWSRKASRGGVSAQLSESSGEHSRRSFEEGSSGSSDPAFVGLCRVLIGLSVLLLLGLAVLVGITLRSDIDWDASVVQVENSGQFQDESGGPAYDAVSSDASPEVIRFDLDRLNTEGLLGPEGGLRALSYEFCIPASEAYAAEIQAIDTSLSLQRTSPGRIGCGSEEYLAIGHTHQADFRGVLVRLSRLPYVDSIEEVHFE